MEEGLNIFVYLVLVGLGIYFAWSARSFETRLINIGLLLFLVLPWIPFDFTALLAEIIVGVCFLGIFVYAFSKSHLDQLQSAVIMLITVPIAFNLVVTGFGLPWFQFVQYLLLISLLSFCYVLIWDIESYQYEIGFLTLLAGTGFYSLMTRPFIMPF